MILNDSSLKIILDLYKEDKVNQDQAIQLIKDLYYKPTEVYTYPYILPQYPQVTWETQTFPEYKVTCNTTEKDFKQ